MTDEDQDAAIGRMVSRFSAAKKERSALLAEASAHGRTLESVGKQLAGLNQLDVFWDGKYDSVVRSKTDVRAIKLPENDKLNQLINDLRTVCAEIRQLRTLMKDAGLNVE